MEREVIITSGVLKFDKNTILSKAPVFVDDYAKLAPAESYIAIVTNLNAVVLVDNSKFRRVLRVWDVNLVDTNPWEMNPELQYIIAEAQNFVPEWQQPNPFSDGRQLPLM